VLACAKNWLRLFRREMIGLKRKRAPRSRGSHIVSIRDMKLGIDLLQIIRPVVRRIEFRAFNHAGHYVFREHAQQVNQLITNFVKSL